MGTDRVNVEGRPTRPAFDPELEAPIAAFRRAMPPLTGETLAEIRALSATLFAPPDLTLGGSVTINERRVVGPLDAPEISLLIASPIVHTGRLPCIYFIHGGGMVLGSRHVDVEEFLSYVAAGQAVVVSVEYRLAPEHPAPAQVEDCYAGLVWIAENAADQGIDPDRILIAGVSAGGGLAAGTALLARDRGFPALTHQILICPMLDDRMATHSSQMLDGEGSWDRNENFFSWGSVLGPARGQAVSPYVAPARAESLHSLPRTYLDSGTVDCFRDEISDYATRLSQAGVNVDLHLWGGGCHGFDTMAPEVALSKAARAVRGQFVMNALGVEH